jgi:prevent-host-death family protein
MTSINQTVTAFDAKNRLGRLLDRAEAGEEMIITRHGQPVARLVPIRKSSNSDASSALATFRRVRESLKSSGKKVSRDEIRSWKSEGRR